ncbi:hypothetical protein [Pseudomonas aeruginosa]|uniref:hypothetical protein n=1 Tax=Pseudomonas aeruginosa TaxID=287 RepID=UPI0015C33C8D|nr:hypothetical protein [Pseudomonas aeruginosa]QLF20655.1 hypothetical protein GNT46_08775 [Pseudomonas aeruginosa]
MDAVKTHEHLHLAQYVCREKFGENERIKLKCPLNVLDENLAGSPYINYLFEPDELEARLHEFVLSFYRGGGVLPLDVDGFIRMLAASKGLSPIIVNNLNDSFALLKEASQGFESYSVRDIQTEKEFVYIMLAINGTDLRRKFILEVLTVMYGNLLGYYGDQRAKMAFLESIERPNLYDALWE